MERFQLVALALGGIMFILSAYAKPTNNFKPSRILAWGIGLSIFVLISGMWLVPEKVPTKGTLAYWLIDVGAFNFFPFMSIYIFLLCKHRRNQKRAEKRSV